MSVERFIALNLLMDLPLLAVTARSMRALRPVRLLLALLAALGYGALAAARPFPWRAPPVQGLLLPCVARLLLGREKPRRLLAASLLMLAEASFAAGWTQLMGRRLWSALSCGPMLALALRARPRRSARWETEVALRVGGKTVRFPAFIDTGNQLREPLSGQPVLIAEAALVGSLLPERGCRRVAYGSLGGGGTLTCFRPDAMWCGTGPGRRRVTNTWVAVSPLPLPGPCRALAPGEFASISP